MNPSPVNSISDRPTVGKISDLHTISYSGRILVIIAENLTTVNIKLSEVSTTNQKVLDPIMSGSTVRSVSEIYLPIIIK